MSTRILNKRSLKIVGATSIALFSLVTVFTATIAWFSLNQKVGSNGMTVRVKEETGRLNKIEIFKLDKRLDESTPVKYSFFDTPAATIYGEGADGNAVLMDDYNPLNPDNPVLILFTLENEFTSISAGDMYVKGISNAAGFLGETSDGAPKYNLGTTAPTLRRGSKVVTLYDEIAGENVTKTVDCYPLSSAVNFKCTQYSTTEYQTLTANSTIGRIDIPIDDSLKLHDSFVKPGTGDAIAYKKDPMIYSSLGGNSVIKYIAMVVNYDADAISAIYSTYLGNKTLEETYGGQFYFTCDWYLEVF